MALQPHDCKRCNMQDKEVADEFEFTIDTCLDRNYRHDGQPVDYYLGVRESELTPGVLHILRSRYHGWCMDKVKKDDLTYLRFKPKGQNAEKVS
jgi:hypothetical protein